MPIVEIIQHRVEAFEKMTEKSKWKVKRGNLPNDRKLGKSTLDGKIEVFK